MSLVLSFKRPFIWFSRFRKRCGYGVHSPFAFSLITDVIYEKRPYYAYRLLERKQQALSGKRTWQWGSKKVNRLLFRLVNRMQPNTIIEVGCTSASSLYLQGAKPSAGYLFATDLTELFLDADASIDFLYLNDETRPELVEEVFRTCVGRLPADGICVIRGICYSKAMRMLWDQLKEDEHVGISFDLYDLGLLFFDKTKIKQHYIVNF